MKKGQKSGLHDQLGLAPDPHKYTACFMATLKDISKKTGVAESTISRILNRDSTLAISESKRRRVIETAEAMQYVTRRERSVKNRDVSPALRPPVEMESIIIPNAMSSAEELAHPYYVGLRMGIEARCEVYGLASTRIMSSAFDVAALHSARNLGVISLGDQDGRIREELAVLGIPVVVTGPRQEYNDVDVTFANLHKGGIMLTNWLLDRGNQRIALLGVPRPNSHRFLGYRDAMETAGRYDPNYVVFMDPDGPGGDEHLRALFQQLKVKNLPPPDVIIAFVDRMAADIYRELKSMGLCIPDDIQVASFNDSAVSRTLDPSLTTLRLEAGVLGEAAVDLIVERQSGREAVKHIEVFPRVIVRDSTK